MKLDTDTERNDISVEILKRFKEMIPLFQKYAGIDGTLEDDYCIFYNSKPNKGGILIGKNIIKEHYSPRSSIEINFLGVKGVAFSINKEDNNE